MYMQVQLDRIPTASIERLECVKLLVVFIESKLSFHEHVERLLSICNQRLYLLRKQGLSDKCIGIVTL